MENKKGTIQDVLLIMVLVFVFTIGSLIAYRMSSSINTEFQDSSLIDSQGKTAMNQITNIFPTVLDNSFMLLVIGLCVIALVMASMVRIHPAFFILFILIISIAIFISGVFSNVYQKIGSNSNFVDLADNLFYMTYVMRFLPFIVGIVGFMVSFVMYKSWQNG